MPISSFKSSTSIFLILITTLKVLLIPCYKSTDFDVHRNWLAITHHLPLSKWYYDDVDGTTVHTLDYPPSFAFFEYYLSNNYFTEYLINHGLVNDRCFALLPDFDNEVGLDCVIFQRCTVIISDVVLLLGAWWLAQSLHGGFLQERSEINSCALLVAANSGLILLDHIHFQYNGFLLGILLASLGCLMQSIKITSRPLPVTKNNIGFELLAAVLFTFLLTLKHLYLTLAPMYFFYLLRRFCFEEMSDASVAPVDSIEQNLRNQDDGFSETTDVRTSMSDSSRKQRASFSFSKLSLLGATVLATLFLPFLPFLMEGKDQMQQLLSRLFPFQRGLCHDYWAGNIWAVYLFLEKLCKFASKVNPILDNALPSQLPEITPSMTAVCLLIGLLPAMYCAYKAASIVSLHTSERQEAILYCTVYSSLSSFMLAYHVHEKAIMTAVIPMTFLAFRSRKGARLFLRLSSFGHFGLMPLLYRPTELLLKVLMNGTYFMICLYVLHRVHGSRSSEKKEEGSSSCSSLISRKHFWLVHHGVA